MSEFLRLLNSHSITEADVDNILRIAHDIGQEVHKRKDEISRAANSSLVTEPTQPISLEQLRNIESSPVLASFAKSVLSMLAAKPYAIMYGPLRQHGLLTYSQAREPR
jgi:hypothetical protein